MTDGERPDNHERRISKLERDIEMHIGLTTRQHGDHEHRIDALERLSRADLWHSVAIGGYQQALTQVQEEVREVRAGLEIVRRDQVIGLSAEDKMMLIGLLNTVVDEVDAIKALLAASAIEEQQKRTHERLTNLERVMGEEPGE